MDEKDRGKLDTSPVVDKIEEIQVLKELEAFEVENAPGSSPPSPMSEVYSLKHSSSESELMEIDEGHVAEKMSDGALAEIEGENVADTMKEGETDWDEPSRYSDASIDVPSSPEKEIASLKDDFHENSRNLEPTEDDDDDDDSPKAETAEQVKEVVVSTSENNEHKALVQINGEIEALIDPEPLMVADISPKSDTDYEVKKEVVVFERKKEDHEVSEGLEDSEHHEDAMVIPKLECDMTSSEDDLDHKSNDRKNSEPTTPVEKAEHANRQDASPERPDNERGVRDKGDEYRDRLANIPEQDHETKEPSVEEKVQYPVSDGRQVSETNSSTDKTANSPDADADEVNVCPEIAAAVKDFVQEASVGAVPSIACHHSESDSGGDDDKPRSDGDKDSDSRHTGILDDSPRQSQRSFWKPLSSYFRFSQDTDQRVHAHEQESVEDVLEPIPTKGRIIFYTRLGCRECKEGRLFLHARRLRYIEINVDLYPGRKLELERISCSPAVPKVFFNEILIGDVNDLKRLEEVGKLQEKIDYIVSEPPPPEAPLPPLSGEDDVSGSGSVDELAVIVWKMQDSIVVKDRFHKMRRITNCFLGSEAVDFISEDQCLQREEAVQFARKLINSLFIHSVLEENVFEDNNNLYRFLNHDPVVSTQCYNIPRGIIEAKLKSITEIAYMLRTLSYAIFDAYTSEDGRHVDYRSIHGSEEFARYMRTVEQLQRVEMQGISREERLAFFINLYNMMAIHAILVLGHPTGALERRRYFLDFQYVVGGCSYSLSAIQNGVLQGNQRPPYSLMKPFGAKDKRLKVALPYSEQLTHFALVCGTRSGPALRCYSPGNIDKELMDAAREFLQNGGFIYDATSNVASVTKILKWFSVDFGKTEVEVLKHASNYLEPAHSEMLLDLLSANQLKVMYQPYDWGLNC